LRGAAPFRVFRIRLPRHCASTREPVFDRHLRVDFRAGLWDAPFHHPRFPLTVALAGARSSGLRFAWPAIRSLHSGRGAVLLRRASCRAGPLTFGSPSLLRRLLPCGVLRFRVSGRTSPVSRPLRAHERSWRASRHLPVLAAVFRIALRSRPTAPLVTARVPLREAIAVFGPVFRPCPSLGRSPGSAPGPALLQGRWARLRSSLRVFSRTGFRWLTVTISPNLV
jgi:hypothetical protein